MALHKNTASQKVLIFVWDTVEKAPKTGDAGNITAYISKDGAAVNQSNDVNPSEIDATNLKGVYAFDLLQAETNCDLFVLKAISSTTGIEIDPVIVFTVVRADYKADISNLDVAVSSRSSHSAANVWAVTTRTLSSFGTLIASIWAYATRILTAGTKDTEIDAIKAKTDTIDWTDITFLKDIEGGRWRIIENQMIFYKSDNTTEVARFNLFNISGVASQRNIYDRQRV